MVTPPKRGSVGNPKCTQILAEKNEFVNSPLMPQNKKKIIHIIQSLGNGGCENMLLRTLPLLDTFDHTIITLKNPGELAPKFVSVGITVKTVSCTGIFDIPGILRLRKLVRDESPDIIITYLFHADMLGRLFLRISEVPIIPFLRTTYNHPKYLIARILEWMTRPLVNQYLANSDAVKDFYIKHIGVHPEKITVIPNGIDIEYFDSIISDPELKKSLSIEPEDFVIICVANLHINKGHQYLLEAFEQVYSSTSPTHCHPGLDPGSIPSPPVQGGELKRGLKLLLVGEGSERKNLEQQIKNYQSQKNIIFLGRRTDVPRLLKISDIFVLPTLFEGQSNAILEAMAAGLPIITTNIPENRILLENASTGLFVEPKNTISLASAIRNIIENQPIADKLSKNVLLVAREKYSLQSIKKFWNDFLSTL